MLKQGALRPGRRPGAPSASCQLLAICPCAFRPRHAVGKASTGAPWCDAQGAPIRAPPRFRPRAQGPPRLVCLADNKERLTWKRRFKCSPRPVSRSLPYLLSETNKPWRPLRAQRRLQRGAECTAVLHTPRRVCGAAARRWAWVGGAGRTEAPCKTDHSGHGGPRRATPRGRRSSDTQRRAWVQRRGRTRNIWAACAVQPARACAPARRQAVVRFVFLHYGAGRSHAPPCVVLARVSQLLRVVSAVPSRCVRARWPSA